MDSANNPPYIELSHVQNIAIKIVDDFDKNFQQSDQWKSL